MAGGSKTAKLFDSEFVVHSEWNLLLETHANRCCGPVSPVPPVAIPSFFARQALLHVV